MCGAFSLFLFVLVVVFVSRAPLFIAIHHVFNYTNYYCHLMGILRPEELRRALTLSFIGRRMVSARVLGANRNRKKIFPSRSGAYLVIAGEDRLWTKCTTHRGAAIY